MPQRPVAPRSSSSTLESERQVFLGLLRSKPGFLLQHVPALTHAVYRRIRTTIALRLNARHRGRKVWPRWLDADASNITRAEVRGALTVFPSYPPAAVLPFEGRHHRPAGLACAASEPADEEVIFAAHRWGFLLDSVLIGSPGPAAALDECRRWMADNTDRNSLAWEPYSACERVANLLTFLAVNTELQVAQFHMADLSGFVDDSARWIYRHLEYYGSDELFNHILNNARTLVMAGAATAQDWAFIAGVTIFRQCLPELIGPEGFLRERSSHYQLIVLNWILDAWRFCASYRGGTADDAQFLHGYAVRMARAASLYCELSGPFLTIGDVSPDCSPEASQRRLARLYPELWHAAPVSRPGFERADGWVRITSAEEALLMHFPSGAYPFGFSTHGHGDLTSFVWRHGMHEVLADCGRYRYTPDALSLFHKSAAAHNVALVNGLAPVCESLLPNGRWYPVPYARAELDSFEHNGGITLTHNGYARATPVRRHARSITPERTGIAVVDSFEGTGSAELTFCWQFGEHFERFEPGEMTAIGRDARVQLTIEGPRGPAGVESAFGGPSGGWLSREYGKRRASLTVRLRWRVDLPIVVSTRFRYSSCAAS